MRVIWEVVAIDKVMVLYSVGRMRVFKVIADKEGLLLVLQCFFHLDELGLVWTLFFELLCMLIDVLYSVCLVSVCMCVSLFRYFFSLVLCSLTFILCMAVILQFFFG